MRFARLTLATVAALAWAPAASAQDAAGPIDEGVREQSCRALAASTAGAPDPVAADPIIGIPPAWPQAPPGLLPGRVDLRTESETFNRIYEFATRAGTIYARRRQADEPWRELPVPPCFAERVASISVDDDELIAIDTAHHIYTMDNALKEGTLFNWSSRWGTPFWLGPGYSLPPDLRAWAWSVVSPVEDETWTDPAGNRTAIGQGKVSHIWGLRRGGQRLTFWDPWLPLDESYEMCGPHRGRFRARSMSASGSYVFVAGRFGDLFTRLYDFDISGHDPVFFSYSYEDQRGAGDGAPIQLPAEPWTEQPKIPGRITSEISIHKTGKGSLHRILRVEGRRGGRTGYWERDVADPPSAGWRFHATGGRLTGKPLRNPGRDTSARALGPSENLRFRMRGDGVRGRLANFNVYCSPARLIIREGRAVRRLRLHHVDGLRQQARGRGLDDVPRLQNGAIEGPPGTFEEVTVSATRHAVLIEERGWRFERVR